MTIHTDLGYIEITPAVIADIAGHAASSCFGVKGMTVRSVSDGLAHLLRRENQRRGRSRRRRRFHRSAYRLGARHQHRFGLPLDYRRSALSCGAPDRRGCQKCGRLRRQHQSRLTAASGG